MHLILGHTEAVSQKNIHKRKTFKSFQKSCTSRDVASTNVNKTGSRRRMRKTKHSRFKDKTTAMFNGQRNRYRDWAANGTKILMKITATQRGALLQPTLLFSVIEESEEVMLAYVVDYISPLECAALTAFYVGMLACIIRDGDFIIYPTSLIC